MSNSWVLFLLTPSKKLLISLVQKWEDIRNATAQASVHSLSSSGINFSSQFDTDCSHPRYLCTSFHHTFPVQSTFHEYRKLWYGTQRTASLFTFCILPSLWRVSVAVIWTTVKLSSPWFCCVDRTILWDRCYSYGLNSNVLKLEKNESR